MQHNFAIFVVRKDTPQAGAVRKHETRNRNRSIMKGLPKRKSPSHKTSAENEDQAMDQNNGLEAKIFREESRTTPTRDLREIFAQFIRIFPPTEVLVREQKSK